MPPALPTCCTPGPGASLAELLYCVYNAGGDPARAGLSWDGRPCPVWADLPDGVRGKWIATAKAAHDLVGEAYRDAIEPAVRGGVTAAIEVLMAEMNRQTSAVPNGPTSPPPALDTTAKVRVE